MFDFFDFIYDFIASGIYEFYVDVTAFFLQKFTVWWIKAKIFGLVFAWDVAKVILQDLDLSSHIQSSWNLIDPAYKGTLTFFRIPEVINNLLTALTTKFVLRMLPF